MAKRIWDDYITEQDRIVYGSGVFAGHVGLGEKPAVLIIDVINKNIGDEPLPILQAIAKYGKGCCGEYGWNAVGKIRALIDYARARGVPVFYSIPRVETQARFDEKMPNWQHYTGSRDGFVFADEIRPQLEDSVTVKPTSSSFYETDLEEKLRGQGIDTLLITGVSTSGCVRATVVDAFARGFKLNVVEDAVFDRGQASHAINLFDMHAKYADVLPLEEVKKRLEEHLMVRTAR